MAVVNLFLGVRSHIISLSVLLLPGDAYSTHSCEMINRANIEYLRLLFLSSFCVLETLVDTCVLWCTIRVNI